VSKTNAEERFARPVMMESVEEIRAPQVVVVGSLFNAPNGMSRDLLKAR
jgi:hypothetical protein